MSSTEEYPSQIDILTYRVISRLLESEINKSHIESEFITFDPYYIQDKEQRNTVERKLQLLVLIKENFNEKYKPLVDRYYGIKGE